MYGYNKYDGCMELIVYMLFAIGFAIGFAVVFAVVCMWLWNYAVVSVFGLPEITFWKMFALLLLVRIAFSPININKNKD